VVGDHDLRVVGLPDDGLDALHVQQVTPAAQAREVGPDGIAAAELGGLAGQAGRGSRASVHREDMFKALDELLGRAQRAGAVRAGVRTGDLIALLKGMFASLDGDADQTRRDVVFTVLTDGLRPPR
jgi:hypothetical protein